VCEGLSRLNFKGEPGYAEKPFCLCSCFCFWPGPGTVAGSRARHGSGHYPGHRHSALGLDACATMVRLGLGLLFIRCLYEYLRERLIGLIASSTASAHTSG
jgi:hypothetical protein